MNKESVGKAFDNVDMLKTGIKITVSGLSTDYGMSWDNNRERLAWIDRITEEMLKLFLQCAAPAKQELDVDRLTVLVDKVAEIARKQRFKLVIRSRQSGESYFYFNLLAKDVCEKFQPPKMHLPSVEAIDLGLESRFEDCKFGFFGRSNVEGRRNLAHVIRDMIEKGS